MSTTATATEHAVLVQLVKLETAARRSPEWATEVEQDRLAVELEAFKDQLYGQRRFRRRLRAWWELSHGLA